MLTIVPGDLFKKLLNPTVEEDSYAFGNASKKPFSWDEMLKKSAFYGDILQYLKLDTNNVKAVGEGSARVAFMLQTGSLDSSGKACPPSCFKVAKNERGVAQNEAELSMFTKFDYACFPKLYNYDKKNKYFMLTELGTSIDEAIKNSIFSFPKYFKEWCDEADEAAKKKTIDSHGLGLSTCVIFSAFKLLVYEFATKVYDAEDLETIYNFAKKMAEKHKKYEVIFSLLDFCKEMGSKMEYGDFKAEGNWGVVVRDGEAVPIPIDFGFTKEVANKYYW